MERNLTDSLYEPMAMKNPTLLCVPLTQPTPEEMVSVLQAPGCEFDVAEIRVDYLTEPRLEPFFSIRSCPLLFTNRALRDHGGWKGTEEARLEVLNRAIELGADWIDVERECVRQLKRKDRSQVIVSYHNFDETPENLLEIAQGIEALEGDVVKVATMARAHRDNARMFEVLRRIQKPVIGVTMGPLGHVVRILGPRLGAFLVFASLQTGQESAPGQVPAEELIQHYRFREMNHETEVYGLVDLPKGEWWAKTLNKIFTEAGKNAVALPLETEDLADVLLAYRNLPFSGFSLGPRHWERAMVLADELEPGTRVVNTITWRDGHWIGMETHFSPTRSKGKMMETGSMLARQASLWTGKPFPRERLESQYYT